MSRSYKSRKPKGYKKPIPKSSKLLLLRNPYATYVWVFENNKIENNLGEIINHIYDQIDSDCSLFPDGKDIFTLTSSKNFTVKIIAKKGNNKLINLAVQKLGKYLYIE